MSDIDSKAHTFHQGELDAQKKWQTEDLWDGERKQKLLWSKIPTEYHQRIEQAPFFFLATSDLDGHCDCSFKGGGPGLIKVIDASHFAFPDFDGNGAFMSLGNIMQNPHVGCLFIDFTDGARLRVNGTASIHENDSISDYFTQSQRAILVSIEQVVPNCKAYIPRLQAVENKA
ncbi:pyridoxamine 5'-phosphate oxidase family protein [sulfur-oxidizing endosymbiont of Gigantopelta aegis]|uniref:pyridoxamine 5'-phosphate oxidase family protein n=1 Tax=sulfur-oxidizing endosymbiont of Gigantopelta aegis TaxID=2794934 RepID=UPI0018DD1AB2|nr:pyridoxamine 5'-phosphate oxidase family protein [sulfur-oxidizing endosymbiont of Gigantopelta aegis]